jgi:ABC-type nitrate/sulfonate/bicarbonate transport system substrate-binding protein
VPIERAGVAILVPRDSPIHTVADLRGHRVIDSSPRGSVSQNLLLEALREAKVAPSELTIGFMLPNDAASAFEAGRISAWAISAVIKRLRRARGARVLRDGKGINSGIGVIAVANRRWTILPSARRSPTILRGRCVPTPGAGLRHLCTSAARSTITTSRNMI